MIFVRPVRRVSLNAASLASVPELVKNTRAWIDGSPSGAAGQDELGQPSASATWAGVVKKLETWPNVEIWPVIAASTVGCA